MQEDTGRCKKMHDNRKQRDKANPPINQSPGYLCSRFGRSKDLDFESCRRLFYSRPSRLIRTKHARLCAKIIIFAADCRRGHSLKGQQPALAMQIGRD